MLSTSFLFSKSAFRASQLQGIEKLVAWLVGAYAIAVCKIPFATTGILAGALTARIFHFSHGI
jgi:hypothetical protein